MQRKVTALVLAVVAVAAIFGASAYTSGTVDRSANVNVVTDDVGLIGLEDGTSGDLVGLDNAGKLSIDFTNGTASGVNPDANFTLGDTADPANASAFNITNNDAEQHTFTVEYTGAPSDNTANIEFRITDPDSNEVVVSEEDTSKQVTLAAGNTAHVVIVVDTTGLTSSDDLSGTLSISA